MPKHEKFIEAFDRIMDALMLTEKPPENYLDRFWEDCQKYWLISPPAVINALEDYRTHAKFKQYPKFGDIGPLIEKRIFPSPDDAYQEACQHVGDKNHTWSHDTVRYAANGVGQVRLRTSTEKAVREAYVKRYEDAIDLFLKGRVLSFVEHSLPPPEEKSDMNDISNWCKNHGAPVKEVAWLLWYMTKKGTVAIAARKRATKQMREMQFWKDFEAKHGKEPQLPPAPIWVDAGA